MTALTPDTGSFDSPDQTLDRAASMIAAGEKKLDHIIDEWNPVEEARQRVTKS